MRQFRLTYVFKRSRAPSVARDLVSSGAAAVPYNYPWRTAAARPGRQKLAGTGVSALAAVVPRARKPEDRAKRGRSA